MFQTLEKEKNRKEFYENFFEEERRQKHVEQIIKSRADTQSFVHNFRRVIESETCLCPRE